MSAVTPSTVWHSSTITVLNRPRVSQSLRRSSLLMTVMLSTMSNFSASLSHVLSSLCCFGQMTRTGLSATSSRARVFDTPVPQNRPVFLLSSATNSL